MWAGLPCAGYLVKILARQRGVAIGQEKLALAIKDRILCRQSLTTIVQPFVPEYGLRAWCVLEPGSSESCGRQGAAEMTPVRGHGTSVVHESSTDASLCHVPACT